MTKLLSLVSLIAVAAALAAGCGATTNGAHGTPTPTGTTSPTPPPPTYYTAHDLQTGVVAVNTYVKMRGLIVTGIDLGTHGLNFWAQDVGGGQYSGIYFYDKNDATPPDLAVGDEVTVEGTYVEFAGVGGTPWTSTESEVESSIVTVTNTGLTPTIDPVASVNAVSDGVGEPWEGCLVELQNLWVKSVGANYGEYLVTDSSGSAVHVDLMAYDSFEPRLVGESLPRLTGILSDAYDDYHLEPRMSADVGGTGNNLPMPLSIEDVQNTTSPSHPIGGQIVTITGVVSATAPYTSTSTNRTLNDFWMQTAVTGTSYGGVFVHDSHYTNPSVSAGDTVTVTGKYIELGTTNLATEVILFPDLTPPMVTASNGSVAPMSMTLHELKNNAKQYEGLYVQLTDAAATVTNMNPDSPADYGTYKIGVGTDSIQVGNLVFQTRTGLALNDTLTTVRGVLYKDHGIWTLEPRAATDVVKQ